MRLSTIRKAGLRWLVVLILVLSPTPTLSQSKVRLKSFGLEGKRITALGISPQFAPSREYLYATTEGDGVYRRALFDADSTWTSLGLQGKRLTALDIQVWGVGPAIFHTPIVGVEPDRSQGDSTLIYRWEDQKWIPADSGIARSELYNIRALSSFESGGHAPPGSAFAGGNGFIYRSSTFARWWVEAFNGGIGLTNVIAVNKLNSGGDVWAGGKTGFFAPWIARSKNEGHNWEVFYPDLSGDNACNSIAIHPTNSERIYAGMEGAVIKTTDGGKNWNYTGLRDTPVYFYGLTLNSTNPEHIYAGGTISINKWALWESFDAGATWQEIVPTVDFTVAGITNLMADRNNPGVIYIATSGNGVWRYESETTGVEEQREGDLPEAYLLEQNYPNPFNAGTVIRFEITLSFANSPVQLAIYNLRGELVRMLLNRQLPAGKHFIKWDGKNNTGREVASGVYFYRLKVGTITKVRKLSLLK